VSERTHRATPQQDYTRFLLAYLQANIQMALEYRASFLIQVVSMFINDGMWLAFWWLYFTKFPVLRDWGRTDVVVLWATLAFGYGLATAIAGNLQRISEIVYRGQLDYYLALPKEVLSHMLVSRMGIYSIGDALFGLTVFFTLGHPTAGRLGLFLVGGFFIAVIFVAFGTLVGSLAFFIGNAEQLATQFTGALIHFSTYPTAIFGGVTRFILFTALPAGFINSIPVHIIREFDSRFALLLAFATVVLWAAAILAFQAGLRRYESGNLVVMRD